MNTVPIGRITIPSTLRPPVATAASAPGPRCSTWIASANVITDCVARASTIGSASTRIVQDPRVAARVDSEVLRLADRDVTITNPGKLYFPRAGITKLELVRY